MSVRSGRRDVIHSRETDRVPRGLAAVNNRLTDASIGGLNLGVLVSLSSQRRRTIWVFTAAVHWPTVEPIRRTGGGKYETKCEVLSLLQGFELMRMEYRR